MATITRVNGLKATVGKLVLQRVGAYKVTVKVAAGTAVDLRGEDDAVNEVVEAIVAELNPVAYFTVDNNTGVMYMLLDRSYTHDVFNTTYTNPPTNTITQYDAERSTDISELQSRIRTIGKDANATTTSIGPNDIDISGTVVEAAVSMTFGV